MSDLAKPPPGVCSHDAKPKFNVKIVTMELDKIGFPQQTFLRLNLFCPLCSGPFTFRGHIGVSTAESNISMDAESILIPVDYPGEGPEEFYIDDTGEPGIDEDFEKLPN